MKLKQLFVGIISLSVILVSCSKEDVYVPKQESVSETMSVATTATKTASTSVVTPKAYIFIEPNAKFQTVKTYLSSLPKSPSFPINFTGFFGVNGNAWKFTYQNYVDMPYWNNGTLPSIIDFDIVLVK